MDSIVVDMSTEGPLDEGDLIRKQYTVTDVILYNTSPRNILDSDTNIS